MEEQAAVEEPASEVEEAEAEPEPAENDEQESSSTYGLGDAVQVGDASWVITSARKANELADPFGVRPAKQGTFIIADFQFTNEGNESKTLHQRALQLVDSSGRTSDPDTDTFMYIPQERNIFLEQVNPGVTQEGQVIFTVASDASGLTLALKDTNIFRSVRNQAEVDLGF